MLVHMFQRLIKFLSEYAIRWDTILLLKHLPASSNTDKSMVLALAVLTWMSKDLSKNITSREITLLLGTKKFSCGNQVSHYLKKNLTLHCSHAYLKYLRK